MILITSFRCGLIIRKVERGGKQVHNMTTIIELKNLSIGWPKKMKYGTDKELETAICKETVEEVFLAKDGFRGDGVADLQHHGGLDRAVCVYPYEHYALWEQKFNKP